MLATVRYLLQDLTRSDGVARSGVSCRMLKGMELTLLPGKEDMVIWPP